MRICVDVQAAVQQTAGVGRYTSELVRNLGSMSRDEFSLFYFDFSRNSTTFTAPNTVSKPCRWFPGRIAQYSWKTFKWPPFNLFAGDADIYHFPNFIIPPLARGKAIVTIHDMSFVRFPQFTEEKNLAYLSSRIKDTVKRADAIITDSIFSADEIAALTGTPRDRIFPIHLGIAQGFMRPPDIDTRKLLDQLNIKKPYLLTVGTMEPRKNVSFLVEMFERMTTFEGNLVIAGRHGWKYEATLERIRKSPLVDRIIMLPDVSDRDLPALYAGASLFAIASFYEGFGFPPLESMACGTPVLSSNGGSLPEVLGDAAVIMDRFDAEAWAARAMSLITDNTTRINMIRRGHAVAARYTWQMTAQKTLEVYERVSK